MRKPAGAAACSRNVVCAAHRKLSYRLRRASAMVCREETDFQLSWRRRLQGCTANALAMLDRNTAEALIDSVMRCGFCCAVDETETIIHAVGRT